MANYSMGQPLPEIENGHTFVGDNFAQLLPHTAIFEGITGLTFDRCNLVNCDIPEDAVCLHCTPKHASWCTNLYPHLVGLGLTACGTNCSHVAGTDEITIDGEVVDTVYHYSDTKVE